MHKNQNLKRVRIKFTTETYIPVLYIRRVFKTLLSSRFRDYFNKCYLLLYSPLIDLFIVIAHDTGAIDVEGEDILKCEAIFSLRLLTSIKDSLMTYKYNPC